MHKFELVARDPSQTDQARRMSALLMMRSALGIAPRTPATRRTRALPIRRGFDTVVWIVIGVTWGWTHGGLGRMLKVVAVFFAPIF